MSSLSLAHPVEDLVYFGLEGILQVWGMLTARDHISRGWYPHRVPLWVPGVEAARPVDATLV